MLVLTRRPGESIILSLADGTTAKIEVSQVNGGQVRIGVDAPKSIGVDREEIYIAKQRTQQEG